jgi:hypothetical protein
MKPTAPIVPSDGEYQVDLAFLNKYASKNENYKVILQLIHLRSRYLYSKLLKKKSEAANALMEIIPTLPIQMYNSEQMLVWNLLTISSTNSSGITTLSWW